MRYGEDFQETTIIRASDIVDGLFIAPVSRGRTILGVRLTLLEAFDRGASTVTVGDDLDDDGYVPLDLGFSLSAVGEFYNSAAGEGAYRAGRHYLNPARLLVQIPGITSDEGKLRMTVVYSGDAVPPTRFD